MKTIVFDFGGVLVDSRAPVPNEDGTRLEGIALGGDLLLRPSVFLAVLAACLVFNALSTLLPAWMATRRSIAYTLTGGE